MPRKAAAAIGGPRYDPGPVDGGAAAQAPQDPTMQCCRLPARPPDGAPRNGRPAPASAWASALLLGAALACGPAPPAPTTATGQAGAEGIISMSPVVTELVYALGLGDRLLGVDDFSAWPPEVAATPRLGGLFNPNLEAIVALQPDLAILLPSQQDLGRKLERLGIDRLEVRSDSLADIDTAVGIIAERCGVAQTGAALRAELREALAPRPLPRPLRVMISLGRDPGRLSQVVVAGAGSFYEELLERLGATNIFADTRNAFPQVGLEAILARRPEVILEIRYQEVAPDSELAQALRRDWRALAELPAVRAGRIEVFGGGHMVVPGPRLPEIYAQLEAALRGTL